MIASLVTVTVSPVTIPVPEPTDAMPGALLLQVPKGVRSLKDVVKPEHTLSTPSIAVGKGLTVMAAVLVVDTDPPVTTPEVNPTDAIPLALLLHVPPAVISLNVVVRPEHTSIVPVIKAGNGFTVTTTVAIQPVGNV